MHLPTHDDVRAAAGRLDGVAHRTPVLQARTLNERLGADVFFKCENLQRMGAFKFRGAYNAIMRLPEAERRRGVVAFSSGNHAQAVALSARLLGTRATIVMPHDAPAAKVAATRGYGAEVVVYNRLTEDRQAIATALAETRGLSLVPPFDDAGVIAGQGTAALELLQDCPGLDILVAPLGGGGLLSGCALAAQGLAPDCRLYGVEPTAGDDVRRSLEAGHIVAIEPPTALADGALTTRVGDLTFAIIREHVAGVLTASDDDLVQAMRFYAERMKLVVEPTGALSLAALLNGQLDVRGARVGVVISGGNVDLARYAALLG
ncbi:threo-3-hydroxy-L-aspartate ammonia-lyase [Verticiella sediminum]|uniref:Threo-3-hydroxy-L-aspartate ammonia-lyase n=1 Tax=Verticiella sediminum TaxID=1247510 RepID=A0A556AU19_9BURK|nr:threo-3-hydroxy-L-aspartate ammonia-lyase [Verticiella sediminum]TSH96442.1 threo-3-hydroxy-L-aspartate ammonia-lyase [Verticiella sediminum]